MGQAFEKQIKTIEDQAEKHTDVIKDLKPKEQTKLIEDKSNNQKRKKIMSELYDSIDFSNLNFDYVGNTKDVSFYEYKNFKELFNVIKNNQIKISEVKNKQNEFLNKLNNIKIGKKTIEQKETINNLEKFYNSREEVINFFKRLY